jgi:hypothetical protein
LGIPPDLILAAPGESITFKHGSCSTCGSAFASAPTPSASRLKELERAPAETFERAVQILALLQRDGRLVDFLAGNISPYPDVQLGAAAPAMRCFNGWEIIEDLAVRARKSHETASRRQDHHALRTATLFTSIHSSPSCGRSSFTPTPLSFIAIICAARLMIRSAASATGTPRA